jgi:leucyl-tRNA synthetase
MSEQAGHPDHDPAGHDAATYDMAAAQDKWRKVWEELDPFRAG